MSKRSFRIAGRPVGGDAAVFVIAELSANHNQNLDLALETIEAASKSGADAIKLQTYTPDTITLDCDNEYFQIKQGTIWDGQTLHALYREAYTPWEWHEQLQRAAHDLGLILFSSPFDNTAVDFLERLNVPAYKVASFELTDVPLVRYIARRGKPIIMSTGIATHEEVAEAVAAARSVGNDQIALLKCTSAYPAPYEDMNLNTIPAMREEFGTVVGLSDHTMGISIPVAATALGARIIEKHFILDRSLGGPDSQFSLEPAEFKAMVESIRNAEAALGGVHYGTTEKTAASRQFSRSLFAVRTIEAGERLTEENVRSIRPGFGLAPKHLDEVVKRSAKVRIERGTPLSWELID